MDLTEKTVSSEKILCVLALDGENQALLVRQFRYPYMQELRELPAGKLEYGEDPREAAVRELREETGAVAGKFQSLGELYPSPGYFGETDLDEDEFLTLERIPFSQLVQEVMDGKIKDAKTIAAALKAKTLLHL